MLNDFKKYSDKELYLIYKHIGSLLSCKKTQYDFINELMSDKNLSDTYDKLAINSTALNIMGEIVRRWFEANSHLDD